MEPHRRRISLSLLAGLLAAAGGISGKIATQFLGDSYCYTAFFISLTIICNVGMWIVHTAALSASDQVSSALIPNLTSNYLFTVRIDACLLFLWPKLGAIWDARFWGKN